MKKMKFFGFLSFAVLGFIFLFNFTVAPSAFAAENEVNITPDINDTGDIITEDSNISPQFVNDFRSRKKNVTYSEEWSGYSRISNNLNTYNSNGGSITANKTVSFKTDITGSVSGLSISSGGTISSSKNYTLSVAPNKKVYLGFRVRYKVEKGTREYYDITNGKVISTNKYTVKTPIYGEYKLITY